MKFFNSSFIASVAAVAALLLLPPGAYAHPMGNFSINHYSKLALNGTGIHIEYILDFAEIPTFQLFPEFRTGTSESKPQDLAAEWARRLQLSLDGQALPLVLVNTNVERRPGVGSLPTVRATLQLESRWPAVRVRRNVRSSPRRTIPSFSKRAFKASESLPVL